MIRKRLEAASAFIAVAALASPFAAASAQEGEGKRAMTAVDMVEAPAIGSPLLSPDGRYLLYARTAVDWALNEHISRLRLIDAKTGEATPLFEPEDDEEEFDDAAWRPDSAGFLVLLEREGDEAEQAYFYDLETRELTRVTDHPTDVEDVAWASDGAAFYYTAEDPRPDEIAALGKHGWLIREYDDRPPEHLWRYDFATEASQRLTEGADTIRYFDISSDGQAALIARTPGRRLDDRQAGELWRLDLESGAQTQLTSNTYYEIAARFSPDASAFAYIAGVNEAGEQYYQDNVFVQMIGSPTPTLIAEDSDYEFDGFSWSRDGEAIFLRGNMGVRAELFSVALDDGALTRLTSGDHVISSWRYNHSADKHVLRFRAASTPGDFWVADGGPAPAFSQVTHEYRPLAETFALPRVEVVRWEGRGGAEIEGLLAYPLDYDNSGEPFPLVTITHGGPRSSATFSIWSRSRYIPVLTGQGYGVFLPNHRGGVGYGDAFMRDMIGRYFRNAHHDVLDGVDYLVDQDLADPDRLVKKGWSAGGHMVNKVITVTDRFKAAASGAGAADWRSMYAESDVRNLRTYNFGGAPWQQNAPTRNYLRDSVLQDLWRAKTPTLIFVGERDIRVPPTQSILLYRGLQAAGAPTELYVAPGQAHNFSKPSYQLFLINRELEWFAQYALGETYEPVFPRDGGFDEEGGFTPIEKAEETSDR